MGASDQQDLQIRPGAFPSKSMHANRQTKHKKGATQHGVREGGVNNRPIIEAMYV